MRFVTLTVFVLLQFCNVDGSRISKEKCQEHYKPALPIDQYSEDAVLKEFPFMALVTEPEEETFSNGILVSEKYVLTTADVDFRKAEVYLGRLTDPRATDENHGHLQLFKVVRDVVHPRYSNDATFKLKLLELDGSAEFNHYVQPACLAQPESHISSMLLEVGWGVLNIRDSKQLHKMTKHPISNSECEQKFRKYHRAFLKHIDDGMIVCAATEAGGRDLCYGYGAASLLNNNRNMAGYGEVVALAIDKLQCHLPTVFIRISENLDWIESVVWVVEPSKTILIVTVTVICIAILILIAVIMYVIMKRRAAERNSSTQTPIEQNKY